ncbi:hypothetical protein CO659_16635 [Rhizobium sp. S9]|uniref:hypothetical protein n=1 Tax=unclassified Rhizobium TaxID=2613769 RepID=UPI000A26F5E5|nr:MULTISPECIES: hypothetical protein [unclassified Rhizobium]PDS96543.1 hypothetical protein CO659_16635 [Rhizobium sp. S9]
MRKVLSSVADFAAAVSFFLLVAPNLDHAFVGTALAADASTTTARGLTKPPTAVPSMSLIIEGTAVWDGYAACGTPNSSFKTRQSYIGERLDAEISLMYFDASYCDPAPGPLVSRYGWRPTQDGAGIDRNAYLENTAQDAAVLIWCRSSVALAMPEVLLL